MKYNVTVGEKTYRVDLERTDSGWRCLLDGREFPIDAVATHQGVLSLIANGRSYEIKQQDTGAESSLLVGQQLYSTTVRDPRSFRSRRRTDTGGQGARKIVAPMPGKVVRIVTPAGSAVEAGQSVVVIEAMKMQNELKSPKAGTVARLNVIEGAAVEAGQVLAEVE